MSLRITLLVAAGFAASTLVAACAAPAPDPSLAPSTPVPAPVTASDVDGRYTVTLSLPRDTWAAGEPIEGLVTLALEPGPDAVLSGSGGPIGFSYTEVNGTRRVDPGFTADCRLHPISAATPITRPLSKSGGWSDDMPDADFYREFLTGDGVRLPAGDWDIAVVLAVSEGPDCLGRSLTLDPTVRIHVTDGPAPSP